MEKLYGFALKQGIGAPSVPIVKENERVKRGQLIAKCPSDKLGNHIHSSITGTVKSIDETNILIQADEEQSPEFIELVSDSPLDLIKEAGIIGLGGAGFPTVVKLSHRFDNKGTILINASECEPILSHNIKRTEKNPAEIIRGIEIVMDLTNATDAIIAIKGYHDAAIAALKNVLPEKIQIHELPNIYPVGDERAVVRECLDILLDVDQLPLAADAIVINLETVFRIYQAVDLKKPLIDKDLTVAGKLVDSGAIKTYFDEPLGMKFSAMFDLAGGIGKEYGEIVEGGPFMGKRAGLDDYLHKTTGGLIASEVFWNGPEKLGLLVCACGAHKDRLSEIAESMGSEIAGIEYCKQAIEVKGTLKCTNPGICPGQVQKVMALKKAGAQAVLISNCTDCSNTVMSCAPQLKLPVYHATDGSLRACNLKLVRRMKSTT
ncbi:proline reductase-associated electron transfer protein PrdC [Enterococcus malodoratus]|uniref:proline reductase-associated electron transfer protein PrdC n=1 Tax=Enterococcus malodoratus TaxID=71451 RepID=UPI0008D5E988|nr:proline reductase-associated electron transfer protein PrdC [Enterococcus malodoratus]SET19463.1 proline reductase-associated electron transfer protein PrdC [Enterococcus malodoratus]